jgi:1,4-dihydroxy-2-naphthoate octaprenyltransferase
MPCVTSFERTDSSSYPEKYLFLLLYLGGTWLGPVASAEGGFVTSQGLVALIFAGVLLMNLGVISLYDIQLDSRMGISSLANILGKKNTKNLLMGTAAGIYLLSVLQFLVFEADRYTQFALILCGMATILLLVVYLPSRFRKNDLYRWTADAVLYMGFLSLLVNA